MGVGARPVYTPAMRPLRPLVILIACASLLGVQLSGVHMHINADGFAGVPEGTHIHGAASAPAGASADHAHDHDGDSDNGDHEGDRDVSVQLGAGVSKVLVFISLALFVVALLTTLPAKVTVCLDTYVPRARRDRWRPPLRAPPTPAIP